MSRIDRNSETVHHAAVPAVADSQPGALNPKALSPKP